MNLHDDKHLPPASSVHIHLSEPGPFRLLDLPAEIRLMIYSYALGSHNSRWRLAIDPSHRYVLELCDACDPKGHRPTSLLRTCKSISFEALAVLYNQTHFAILFGTNTKPREDSGYLLRLPFLLSRPDQSLTSIVLKRIKHLRFFFLMDRLRMHICFPMISMLGYHAQDPLKSLRLIFNSLGFKTVLANTYFSARMLRFPQYHGNAILEFLDDDPTEEDIAVLKRSTKLAGNGLSISAIKKSDISSREKEWWVEFAD